MNSLGAKHTGSRQRSLLRRLYRPLIISGFLTAGLFQVIPQVLAAGTTAGETINNTATATYTDPSGNSQQTTSNTVTVTVAEVAGLTNVAQTPIDPNAGSVIPGDFVQFPFLVTNTGNNPTGIFIPSTVAGIPNQNLDNELILVDTNNDGTPDFAINPTTDQLYPAGQFTVASNGVVSLTGTASVPAGVTDSTGGFIFETIAADATIRVTVQGTAANVPNGIIEVQLGSTGSNDSTNPDSQNQPDFADGLNNTEIRTVDEDSNGDTTVNPNEPTNGEREAADSATPLTIGQTAPSPLALATILKTAISTDDRGTTTAGSNPYTDDVIQYGLSLEVDNALPAGITGYSPAPLEGTALANLGGSAANAILVSDAIPANTVLDTNPATGTPAPVAPVGWRVVYSVTPLTTTATQATWTTTPPVDLTTVTRVGFIYDPDNNVATASPSLALGTLVTGFQISVVATGATTDTPSTIFNLAQVFGESVGDPNDNVVFDESGDQNPNNTDNTGNPPTDDNGTPGDEPYGDFDPTATTGNTGEAGNPRLGDQDANNNNSGTGPDGEPNPVDLITPLTPPIASNLLTGPQNAADALGGVGNNDDFTNLSTTQAVVQGGTITPGLVTFTNTVANTSGINLANVVLRPIAPSDANTVCVNCDYVDTPIPNGTTITITQGAGSATYTYNAGIDLTSTADDTITLTSGSRIELASLAVGTPVNYTVAVQLPANTPVLQGYTIPIVAYVNNDGNDAFNPTTELINNITIDRVYTGYLDLLKEARVLPQSGTPTAYSTTPPAAAPGDTIQYRITYRNISSSAPAGGQGNVLLPANSVVIIENGLGANVATSTNDWALDQDGNGTIDTQNVTNTASATQGSIQFYNGSPAALGSDLSGTTAATDVTEYRNTVGTVSPGATGTFTFQRRVTP